MSEKIFCENCKWYYDDEFSEGCDRVIQKVITPIRIVEYTLKPEKSNKDNDCKYYKQSLGFKIKKFFTAFFCYLTNKENPND
jgi:hypothetical protein